MPDDRQATRRLFRHAGSLMFGARLLRCAQLGAAPADGASQHWRAHPLVGRARIGGVAACSGQSCSCITPIKGGFPLSPATRQRDPAARHARPAPVRLRERGDHRPRAPARRIGLQHPARLLGDGDHLLRHAGAHVPPELDSALALTSRRRRPTCSHFDARPHPQDAHNLPVDGPSSATASSRSTPRASEPADHERAGRGPFRVDGTTQLTGLGLVQRRPSTNIDDGGPEPQRVGLRPACATWPTPRSSRVSSSPTLKGQVGGQLVGRHRADRCACACMDKSDCSRSPPPARGASACGPDGKTCMQELGRRGRPTSGALSRRLRRADPALIGPAGGARRLRHRRHRPVARRCSAAGWPIRTTPACRWSRRRRRRAGAASASFASDIVPDGTTPFHVGIGVHRSHLDQRWATRSATPAASAWTSAADGRAALSRKTLGVIIPSLGDLIHGDDAPMVLAVRPQSRPPSRSARAPSRSTGRTKDRSTTRCITMSLPDFGARLLPVRRRSLRAHPDAHRRPDAPVGLDIDLSGKLVPHRRRPVAGLHQPRVVANSGAARRSRRPTGQAFPMLLGLAGWARFALPEAHLRLPTLLGLSPQADGHHLDRTPTRRTARTSSCHLLRRRAGHAQRRARRRDRRARWKDRACPRPRSSRSPRADRGGAGRRLDVSRSDHRGPRARVAVRGRRRRLVALHRAASELQRAATRSCRPAGAPPRRGARARRGPARHRSTATPTRVEVLIDTLPRRPAASRHCAAIGCASRPRTV